jgi:hypothetical protein
VSPPFSSLKITRKAEITMRAFRCRITGVTLRYCRPATKAALEDWRLDASISGGGLFMDLGSHQLDMLDWLVGPLGVRHMKLHILAISDVEGLEFDPLNDRVYRVAQTAGSLMRITTSDPRAGWRIT